MTSPRLGTVTLVGAGPGDPDLLTVGGLRALQAAAVVVHDRLVDRRILALAPSHATLVPVGKHKGGGWSQEAIGALLVLHAREGRDVVRLKGGDPFLFGRGGEELSVLAAAGVPAQVVPGVSSALAAPAAAGIPVTHRGAANAVTIVSGHVLRDYDWDDVARAPGTLVVLMAASTAADVAAALLRGGRRDDEPVAVVHAATTAAQRVARLTLAELARVGSPFPAPSVLVIGAVASLATADELAQLVNDR
jgi:uroporphyrin-III C-methyltransferase